MNLFDEANLLVLPHRVMRINVLRNPVGVEAGLESQRLRRIQVTDEQKSARHRNGGDDRHDKSDGADQGAEGNRFHMPHSSIGHRQASGLAEDVLTFRRS